MRKPPISARSPEELLAASKRKGHSAASRGPDLTEKVRGDLKKTLGASLQRPAPRARVLLPVKKKEDPTVEPEDRQPSPRAAAFFYLAGALALGAVAWRATSSWEIPTEDPRFEGSYVDFPIEAIPQETAASARIRQRLKELDPKVRHDELEKQEGMEFGVVASRPTEVDDAGGRFETRDQRIGNDILIQPYAVVEDIATPQEYLAFLFANVRDPHDASELADHRFIPYDKAAGALKPAAEYPEMAIADCEGFSLLACESLAALEDRQGVSYHPRVIAQGNLSGMGHAICMYEQDGKIWVIDQSPPFKPKSIERPFEISGGFVPWAETTGLSQEWVGPGGYIYDASLTPGLEVDFSSLQITSPEKTFDYKTSDYSALIPQWREFAVVNICYDRMAEDLSQPLRPLEEKCGVLSIHYHGKLHEVLYKAGEVKSREFDIMGDLSRETYREGDCKWREFDAKGRVTEEEFKRGEYQRIVYNYLLDTKIGYKFSGEAVVLD